MEKEVVFMKISEEQWKKIQEHLGYTDEELQLFKKNPRNEEILLKGMDLLDKTIVAEVVDSHGCNSQHKVGDKFYFDGAGNLLTKSCPNKICIYALSPLASLIFASNELIYAGVNPNDTRFKRTGCFDVGVRCGGWGHIVLELRYEKRKQLKKAK